MESMTYLYLCTKAVLAQDEEGHQSKRFQIMDFFHHVLLI